jgi:signal transduction histidine kinase/CheY-like chemotaxis protein
MIRLIRILPTHLAHSVMLVTGGFAVVLGLLVLLGWHTHNVHLLQMIPTFAPMQYNAALGLLLCGCGVLALVGGWGRLAGVCGALVMLLGVLTLSEYLGDIDLGIDQLFMQHFIAMATAHPGRMSLNTALCFMLLGAIVVVMRTSVHGVRALLLTGLGSVVVVVLGLVACFGYLVQVKGIHGWAFFTDLAVHTAVGCMLLGLGLTAGVWRQGKVHPTWAPRWGIALVGLSIATATLCLWQALLVEERAHILGVTSLQAASVQRQIVARMESRVVPLVRMARGWERGGKPEKEAWESDAELYVSLYPSSQAMVWVDPSFHVRWVAPLTGNETAQDFDLGFEEQRRRTLELVGGNRTAMITRALGFSEDAAGFQVSVPLFVGTEFDGFLLGTFRLMNFLDTALDNIAPGYGIAIFDGKEELYRRASAGKQYEREWGQKALLDFYGARWQIKVWPTRGLLLAKHSFLPNGVLAGGMLMAVLLTAVGHLAYTTRARARQVASANQELQREIAERQRAEEQLQRQQEALLQREKLAAMGSLLASVAHELNNPLAIIMVQSDLLREEAGTGPLAERAAKITQAAERSVRIVKSFLTLARQRAPERVSMRLDDVVAAAVELLAYSLQVDNIEVDCHLAAELPTLWADPHQLQQVVVNLLSNAQQAMQAVATPRRLTISTAADAACRRVQLTIADTGPGIPHDLQQHIFEPFFTTKPLGLGTGLGLSLCQGIVESHGGTIHVESTPGQGAVFRIELPVEDAPVAVLAPPPVETLATPQEGAILVVDDEAGITSALEYLLQCDGYQVETAANGRMALEKLRERTYDLLLSDLRMPELDGMGLYEELTQHYPHLLPRLIFLTGDTLNAETTRLLEQVGAPRLSKPFTATEVRRVVQQALQAL